MKNVCSPAPLYIPADLRPEEFATYFAALAAWTGQHPKNLVELFQSYRTANMGANSPGELMEFLSALFFECRAGSDLLEALHHGRQASRTLGDGQPAPSAVPAN